jgi:hypothetical protein
MSKKFIKNLYGKTQSVLRESLVTDTAELLGVGEDEVSGAIDSLSFADYLQLGNAVDVGDVDTAREMLDLSGIDSEGGVLPDEIAESDFNTRKKQNLTQWKQIIIQKFGEGVSYKKRMRRESSGFSVLAFVNGEAVGEYAPNGVGVIYTSNGAKVVVESNEIAESGTEKSEGHYRKVASHKYPSYNTKLSAEERKKKIEAEVKRLKAKDREQVSEAPRSIYGQMADENKARMKKIRDEEKLRKKIEKAEWNRKYGAAAQKKQSKAARMALDDVLLNKVENAISNSFPDGDPIDWFSGFLHKHDLDLSDVDRVMKKRYGRTYDQYQIDMWDSFAADSASDANTYIAQGQDPGDSPFWRWDGDRKSVV